MAAPLAGHVPGRSPRVSPRAAGRLERVSRTRRDLSPVGSLAAGALLADADRRVLKEREAGDARAVGALAAAWAGRVAERLAAPRAQRARGTRARARSGPPRSESPSCAVPTATQLVSPVSRTTEHCSAGGQLASSSSTQGSSVMHTGTSVPRLHDRLHVAELVVGARAVAAAAVVTAGSPVDALVARRALRGVARSSTRTCPRPSTAGTPCATITRVGDDVARGRDVQVRRPPRRPPRRGRSRSRTR